MKVCTICNHEKEINEYYCQKKIKKTGEESLYYHPYCKECTIKRNVKWQQENKDKRKIYNHKYSVSDKGKSHFYKYQIEYRKDGRRKIWEQKNHDKMKSYRLKRKEAKTHDISDQEWESCKTYFNYSCAYCEITEKEHKIKHNQQLHKEHVDPNGLNDLSNCIPACKSCNSGKHDANFYDWYNDVNEKYSESRKHKIVSWLENDYKLYIE